MKRADKEARGARWLISLLDGTQLTMTHETALRLRRLEMPKK